MTSAWPLLLNVAFIVVHEVCLNITLFLHTQRRRYCAGDVRFHVRLATYFFQPELPVKFEGHQNSDHARHTILQRPLIKARNPQHALTGWWNEDA